MSEEGIGEYELKRNALVNVRNAVAHGENGRMIDPDKMNENIELVTNLINAILLKEIQFIQEEAYLQESNQ